MTSKSGCRGPAALAATLSCARAPETPRASSVSTIADAAGPPSQAFRFMLLHQQYWHGWIFFAPRLSR